MHRQPSESHVAAGRATWPLCLAVWGLHVAAAGPGVPEACVGLAELRSVTQVHSCAEDLASAESTPESLSRALRKIKKNVEAARTACSGTEQKITQLGCKRLSDLAYEFAAEGTFVVATCLTRDKDLCSRRGRAAAELMTRIWELTENEHRFIPTGGMVTGKLVELADDVFKPLFTSVQNESPAGSSEGESLVELPPAWHVAAHAADRLKFWLEGYIWRETHWLWLADSLDAQRVVHTTWGSPEEWKQKFGVHDCHTDSPLLGAPPRYVFSDIIGMRWEILANLLRELYVRRGKPHEPLLLVEIGVFSGILAEKLLKELSFIQMVGVDPYIGSDGTFPGTFSETLDPDVAMYKASITMEPYGKRAVLWTVSSEAAAASMPDGVVDALFVDGCHLYDCVRQDLDLWLPKLKRGEETLVAGHDFSPQWPGVVRAVHERRAGGKDVNLASDWVFWWHEHMT